MNFAHRERPEVVDAYKGLPDQRLFQRNTQATQMFGDCVQKAVKVLSQH